MGRKRKDCPVEGCESKALLKLSNHMKQVHNLVYGYTKEPQIEKQKPQSAISWSPESTHNMNWWNTQSLVPFEPCSSIMVCGPTGCGKSRWVYQFIQHLQGMYVQEPPQKVLYCYGVYQPLFDEMEKTIPNITFHENIPSKEDIETFADGTHGLIVLDDLQQQVISNPDIELLFTQGCHHRRLSVIFIVQNLYGQGKHARTIALNSWYLVLFKNVRGTSQIRHLNSQLFPHKGLLLLQAYEDAVKESFGYLVIDLAPQTKDHYRLKTNIFPGEEPIIYNSA